MRVARIYWLRWCTHILPYKGIPSKPTPLEKRTIRQSLKVTTFTSWSFQTVTLNFTTNAPPPLADELPHPGHVPKVDWTLTCSNMPPAEIAFLGEVVGCSYDNNTRLTECPAFCQSCDLIQHQCHYGKWAAEIAGCFVRLQQSRNLTCTIWMI